jgi:microcystin-dependent protein
MAEPFLAEIRIMSFNFAPQGWAMCNGQFLPINQNQALFSLLGTTYGGDGRTTFALPDLRGRTPIHFGQHFLGERAGEQAHTLSMAEMPIHLHALNATSAPADTNIPASNTLLGTIANGYGPAGNLVALAPSEIGNSGGSQSHQNMQPFLTLTFCIALIGIFPSRN